MDYLSDFTSQFFYYGFWVKKLSQNRQGFRWLQVLSRHQKPQGRRKKKKKKRLKVGDKSKFKQLKLEQDFMIMLSSTSSNVQLFHYYCKAILLSIQSLSRIVLRWCCNDGAMMMPEMILIWGFRVAGILIWGERLIHDTHKRERTRKKNRSFVFNCLVRGGFGLSSNSLPTPSFPIPYIFCLYYLKKSLCHLSNAHASHVLHIFIQLNSKTNDRV